MSKNFITIKASKSTYKIDFTTDTTDIWAIYSKFNGNITSVTLDNVSSYTIDGAAVTLPFEVELNRTYLIEIVKTNTSLAASITFNTSYIQFDEIQTLPDFGTSDYVYILGNDDDVATNRTLLKLDTDLLKPANSLGSGAWSVNPIVNTITLPELPGNGWWRFVLWLHDTTFLISGGNTSSNEKYFVLIDSDLDAITDLSGNQNVYTSFFKGYNYVLRKQFYNYIDNFVYFLDYHYGKFLKLDLNDNTMSELNILSISCYFGMYSPEKPQFNPYSKVFYSRGGAYDLENDVSSNAFSAYSNHIVFFNYIFNDCYTFASNDAQLIVKDDNNRDKIIMVASGTTTTGIYYKMSVDHKNRVVVQPGNGRFNIFRVNDDNKKKFLFTNSLGNTIDYTFLKDNIHLALTSSRIHLIDATDPEGTVQPDYNYLDLPVNCWSLYTNILI